jgi:hypothetical protein
MKISALSEEPRIRVLTMPQPELDITGVYVGDLLSWVMGRAEEGNLWLTIMTNLNVVAVASLVGTAGVILCEGCVPDDEVLSVAREKGVNLFVTDDRIYECSCRLGSLLG